MKKETEKKKQAEQSKDKRNKNSIDIPVSKIFYRNFYSDKRIVVNIGGARSSKTWSILLVFLVRFIQYGWNGLRFLVCRKSTPSLRKTIKKSFEDILEKLNLKDRIEENKQMMEYKYLNSSILFSGLDEASKIKTGEFNYIFMEEADEFTYDDFRVLQTRLSRQNPFGKNQLFLAFNPVDINSWIKHYLIDTPSEDVEVIHSTYRDNPFLPQEYVEMLERLQYEDPEYWKIYGLGEYARVSHLIFDEPKVVDVLPERGEIIYGLDFGFVNPTALVSVRINEKELYIRELLYESGLTNEQLIKKMIELIPDKTSPIYADAEEPARIEEIYRCGFNIKPADKSVKDGIEFLKRFKMYTTKESSNFLKEIKSYKWMLDKNGNVIEGKPVKFNDHLMDALRYAVYSHLKDRFSIKENIKQDIEIYVDKDLGIIGLDL